MVVGIIVSEKETSEKVRATHGRVIAVEVGYWSGMAVGPIILQRDDNSRIELRYNADTQGEVPEIGAIVRVQYTGERIHYILLIEIVKEAPPLHERYRQLPSSQDKLLLGIPPNVATIASVLIIVGSAILFYNLLGDFPDRWEYWRKIIFSIIGLAHYVVAYLLVEWVRQD